MQKTAQEFIRSLTGAFTFKNPDNGKPVIAADRPGAPANTCVTLDLCTKYCRIRRTCTKKRVGLLLYAIVMDIKHASFYPHEYMNHSAVIKNDTQYKHAWLLSNGKQVSRVEVV